MIDMVAISVRFLDKFVTYCPTGKSFIDDRTLIETLGLDLTGDISWDGERYSFTRLRHNFESLASSHASLAFKVNNGTDFRQHPYVKIVGNPAKLLQGHNAFGSDNLELCLFAVVDAFALSDVPFIEMLDWEHAVVDYLDLTYTAHCENDQQAQQVLDMMRNIEVGQTKPWYDEKYKTTMYWNRHSEVRKLKAYLKNVEIQNQLRELNKKFAATKLPHFARQIEEISSQLVTDFARGAIRFEARVYSSWLTQNGVPLSFGLLSDPKLQQNEPDLIPRLWRKAFADVFKAFEGATMQAQNSDSVLDALKIAYGKPTKNGVSYAKANRLYGVYRNIVADGYSVTKANTDRATWMRYTKDFQHVGLSIAQLQNFTGEQSNVIPFVRMLNVDFSAQVPANYTEPLSLRRQLASGQLRLVS